MSISLLFIVCVFVDCATLKTIRKDDVQSHKRIGRNVYHVHRLSDNVRGSRADVQGFSHAFSHVL